MNLIQYIGSIGGITGVLAFVIFLIYRTDHKTAEANLTNLIKNAETQQAEIFRAYNDTCKQHTDAMIDNTKVQTELITWLRRNNGK